MGQNIPVNTETDTEEVKEKNITNYFKKTNTLPNGFKRDYGVGLSSDYIMHLEVDCYYDPKFLRRKLKFLQKNRLDCVFCDSMLCGFNDKIYKTENILRAFESTLLHTKRFLEEKDLIGVILRMKGIVFTTIMEMIEKWITIMIVLNLLECIM